MKLNDLKDQAFLSEFYVNCYATLNHETSINFHEISGNHAASLKLPPYCTQIIFYSNGFHAFLIPSLTCTPRPITIKSNKKGIYWSVLTKKLTSSAPGAVCPLPCWSHVFHMGGDGVRNVTASFLFCLFGVNEQQRIVTCHKTSLLNICSEAGFVTSQWRVHIFPFVLFYWICGCGLKSLGAAWYHDS